MLMLTVLLPAMEMIVNHALKADPDALAKMTEIEGQHIEINCTDWNIIFYITADSDGLQFYKKSPGKINTVVRGTLNHFLHIFMKGADTKTLFNYPIDIEGNTHNIEVLRDAFKNIDIDFEEKLSHYVGDALAHKLCFYVNNTKKTLQKSAIKVVVQAKEYIHCEAKNGISTRQAELFYSDVATLRDDVDRAEARMNHLIDREKK